MEFETKTAEQIVDLLVSSTGDVEYKSVQASSTFGQCARYFTNGFSLGNLTDTTGNVDNGPLLDSNGNPIPIVPDQGLIISSGSPIHFNNQTSDGKSTEFQNIVTDNDLRNYLSNQYVYDACSISFEFRCTGGSNYIPTVSFDYVFASEEYYEYANSAFNDAFAFFLNGENIARLPTTETSTDVVSINNVNYAVNVEYFHGNDPGLNQDGSGAGYDPPGVPTTVWYQTVEADGLTSKLTAKGNPRSDLVNDGWNTMKLVVADVGDQKLDSWVLIEGGTFSCAEFKSTFSPTTSPTPSPSQSPTPVVSEISSMNRMLTVSTFTLHFCSGISHVISLV